MQTIQQPVQGTRLKYKPSFPRKSSVMPVLLRSGSSLIKGFLAGVMIAVGGAVYLSVDSKYLGAVLFSIGLFVIFSYGFSLFTGKIGYCVVQDTQSNLQLIAVWFGNLLGALAVGTVLHFTRYTEKISTRALSLCADKLADTPFSVLILSFFCGMLMFIAADNFKNAANAVQKYLAVIMPVMVFILSGFEHCVANMFYFTAGNSWNFKAIWYLIIMSVGNGLGAVLIPLLHRLIKLLAAKNQAN